MASGDQLPVWRGVADLISDVTGIQPGQVARMIVVYVTTDPAIGVLSTAVRDDDTAVALSAAYAIVMDRPPSVTIEQQCN